MGTREKKNASERLHLTAQYITALELCFESFILTAGGRTRRRNTTCKARYCLGRGRFTEQPIEAKKQREGNREMKREFS